MDVLSDVLRTVRLTGAMYFDVRARAPWAAQSPPIASIAETVMPDFEQVIAFHILLDGECWVQLTDDPESAVHMRPGDAVIFPGGDGHALSAERGQLAPVDLGMYRRAKEERLPFVVGELGGDGEAAHLACGYLGCDVRPYNPILGALPRMIVVAADKDMNLTQDLIRAAFREGERPRAGGETILSKLSELMFLHALRQYIEGLPAESTGWLSGLRDRQVGMALGLMHARPAERWTLDALAREVGLSRSVFAERFAKLMGVPPMQYLGNWRLQRAAQLLDGGGLSIAQAACEVGYESEAAFNRAFKKQVGLPPGSWRRARISAA